MASAESCSSSCTIPVHTLPNELLASIFKASASNPSLHLRDIPRPCIISSVNRRWRDVALELPAIWTNVVIYDTLFLKLPALCLERSSNLPVHMFFPILDLRNCNCAAICSLLDSKYIYGLTVTIDIGSTWPHEQLLNFRRVIGICALHLEFLEFTFTGQGIYAVDCQSDWVVTILLSVLAEVPQSLLQSLRINGVGLFNWPLLPISTTQIPSLVNLRLKIDHQDIEPVNKSWESLSVFLTRFGCLQELVVESDALPLPPHDISPNSTIVLSSLRSLALRWPYKARSLDFTRFIQSIKAPSLTYLELVYVDRSDLNEVARRSDLTSYHALRTLRLGCCAPGPEALCPETYELFDSVRELQLARTDHCYLPWGDSSESEIGSSSDQTSQQSPQVHWPALEVLSYDGCDFDWLHGIVYSRSSLLGGVLQRIRINRNRFSHTQIERLKEQVSVESIADSDSGLLSTSPIVDFMDADNGEDVWALLDELSRQDM